VGAIVSHQGQLRSRKMEAGAGAGNTDDRMPEDLELHGDGSNRLSSRAISSGFPGVMVGCQQGKIVFDLTFSRSTKMAWRGWPPRTPNLARTLVLGYYALLYPGLGGP
jgi:hypothetical protein